MGFGANPEYFLIMEPTRMVRKPPAGVLACILLAVLSLGCASDRGAHVVLFPVVSTRQETPPSTGEAPEATARDVPDEWATPFFQQVPPLEAESTAPRPVLTQEGIASWYRDWRTASGERYRRSSLTAAHRTLPFGTIVKVRNLDNQKEVVVRINDRGPFVRGRIIDLSEAAARRIDLVNTGVANVEIQVLATP